MAGKVIPGYSIGGPRPGQVLNPTTGQWVTPNRPQDLTPEQLTRQAQVTAPQYTTSPTGSVSTFNRTTGAWDRIGTVGGSRTATGVTRSTAGSGGGGSNNAAIRGLINEIRGQRRTYQPAQIPVVTSGADGGSPYDLAGEQAAYGAAKERTGLAMQAAMRGLQAQLSQRGIVGSGIEADKVGELYSAGLGELAGTDRQLAETRAGRAFSAGQADTDRTIGQNTYNVGARNDASRFNADDNLRRMELIARLTQLMY